MTTITDEMVDRAVDAWLGRQKTMSNIRAPMRAVLEAAIGPRLRELEAENSGIKGMAGVLARDVAELQAENARMRSAAQLAREHFAFCADDHEKAGKKERARTNWRYARVLDAILHPAAPVSEGSVEEVLKNPVAVHGNMLRGGIAKLTPAQIAHIYRGDEAREVIAEFYRQQPELRETAPTTADNTVGAAEREVGRYIYRRIERLMDAEPGTPDGAELDYLASIAEHVEEYGEEACADHPLPKLQVSEDGE